jgi:hypothetical protein
MREFKTEKETGGEIREVLYTTQHRLSLPPSWVIIKCNTLISENRGEERPREGGWNEGRNSVN